MVCRVVRRITLALFAASAVAVWAWAAWGLVYVLAIGHAPRDQSGALVLIGIGAFAAMLAFGNVALGSVPDDGVGPSLLPEERDEDGRSSEGTPDTRSAS